MKVLDTLVRRIDRKVAKSGRAVVQAPSKDVAYSWAKHFETRGYSAHVEEGLVDQDHSWLLIVGLNEAPQATGT